jgi:hypothetical protein
MIDTATATQLQVYQSINQSVNQWAIGQETPRKPLRDSRLLSLLLLALQSSALTAHNTQHTSTQHKLRTSRCGFDWCARRGFQQPQYRVAFAGAAGKLLAAGCLFFFLLRLRSALAGSF